jgi:hypothetical protein
MQILTEYLHAHSMNYTTPAHFIKELAKQFNTKYNFHFRDKVKFIADLRELAIILPDWLVIRKVS